MRKISETKLNIASSLILQLISGVCGLILPRLVLNSYGSEVNGLTASVTQILSYTVLLEGGVGGVMRAALYKPLADRDAEGISSIYNQISRIFRKISYIFICFALALAITMKFLVDTRFDWMYVFTMVLILSATTYFNYYFSPAQWMLVTADQKLYIIQFVQIVTTLLKLACSVLVIHFGGGIHTLKIAVAIMTLLTPLVLRLYVKRNYPLCQQATDGNTRITQKREAVLHHIAFFIHHNTDVVILSLFSSLANVSVYTIYKAVINILEQLLASISSGVSAKVGNLIARAEIKQLNRLVDQYETWNNALSTAVATVCCILILPFVSIYTNGVTDADYYQPLFALLLILGSYAYSVRHPFDCVVSAAGHYRQTKPGAIGEVALNLGLSLLLVKPFGLVGVALGTFVAMAFRTVYTVWYLSKHILHRPMAKFVLRSICNLTVSAICIYFIPRGIEVKAYSIYKLFLCAIKVSAIVFPALFGLNVLLGIKNFKMKSTGE